MAIMPALGQPYKEVGLQPLHHLRHRHSSYSIQLYLSTCKLAIDCQVVVHTHRYLPTMIKAIFFSKFDINEGN